MAGTVKTNEARIVPLHSHLRELGFAAFVDRSGPGHLFLKPSPTGNVLGPLQGVKNRLAEFSRRIVTDANVAPMHGWRHRWKSLAIDAGIPQRVQDAILGHAARDVAGTYGDVSVAVMAREVERVPRAEVGSGSSFMVAK